MKRSTGSILRRFRATTVLGMMVAVFAAGSVFPATSNADLPIFLICALTNSCAPDITSGPAEGSSTNAAGATFEFSSQLFDVSHCRMDSGPTGTCTSPQAYPSLSEGPHKFVVYATHRHFNIGCPCFVNDNDTNLAVRNFTLDRTAPTVAIDSGPAELSTVTAPETTFGFSSNDSSATIQCKLDAGTFNTCTSPLKLSGLSNATHTFQVRAFDAANNFSSTVSRNFIVNVPPPATTKTITRKSCKKVKVKRHGHYVRRHGKILKKKKCKNVQVTVPA